MGSNPLGDDFLFLRIGEGVDLEVVSFVTVRRGREEEEEEPRRLFSRTRLLCPAGNKNMT